MQEENFYQDTEQDALTDIIKQRLGEREYMLHRLQEMQTPSKSLHRSLIRTGIGLAMAACVAALLIFQPFAAVSPLDELSIEQPSMAGLRGASEDMAEIEKLMDIPDYEAALNKTEIAIDRLKEQIEEFDGLDEYFDEEALYEEELDKTQLSELRWTYIYLLIKNNENKKAMKELKKYIKESQYAEHLPEAKQLLEKMKNKK